MLSIHTEIKKFRAWKKGWKNQFSYIWLEVLKNDFPVTIAKIRAVHYFRLMVNNKSKNRNIYIN